MDAAFQLLLGQGELLALGHHPGNAGTLLAVKGLVKQPQADGLPLMIPFQQALVHPPVEGGHEIFRGQLFLGFGNLRRKFHQIGDNLLLRPNLFGKPGLLRIHRVPVHRLGTGHLSEQLLLLAAAAVVPGGFHRAAHGIHPQVQLLGNAVEVNLPFVLPLHLRQQGGAAPQVFNFAVGGGDVVLPKQLLQLVIHHIFRLFQQHPEPGGAEFFNIFVRVFGPLHLQHPAGEPGLAEDVHGTAGGGLAGAVGIVGNDDFIGDSRHHPGLLRRQGGAAGGHSVFKARCMDGDGVHIPFSEDQFPLPRRLGKAKGKEAAAFFIHHRVVGVQILGLAVIQHPAAEGDDVAPNVDDRKHHPVAEAVVQPAFFSPLHHIRRHQFLFGVTPVQQVVFQIIPPRQSVTQAEMPDGAWAELTAFQVFQSRPSLRLGEIIEKVPGRQPVDFQHPVAQPQGLVVLSLLRHRHALHLGQKTDGVGVIQIFRLHHKGDGVSPYPAAKTIKGLVFRVNHKGRGLFPVEGAEALQVPPRPLYQGVPPYQLF